MTGRSFQGTVLVAGTAEGLILAANEPISLWGGLDPATGEIIDRRHPLSGEIVTGCVLTVPFGRGSCSASGVLLESLHHRTGPAAIVVSRVDPILGLGAILGDELLGIRIPVLLLNESARRQLVTGRWAEITADGVLILSSAR